MDGVMTVIGLFGTLAPMFVSLGMPLIGAILGPLFLLGMWRVAHDGPAATSKAILEARARGEIPEALPASK